MIIELHGDNEPVVDPIEVAGGAINPNLTPTQRGKAMQQTQTEDAGRHAAAARWHSLRRAEHGLATGRAEDFAVIWMLRDPDGVPALQQDQYAINLTPPLTAGQLIIAVAATATATLRPGHYLDWLRATDSAGTDTFWTGTISVSPNPWGA